MMMAIDLSGRNGTLVKEPPTPPLAWVPAARPEEETGQRVTLGPREEPDLSIRLPAPFPRYILVQFKGVAETSATLATPAKYAASIVQDVDENTWVPMPPKRRVRFAAQIRVKGRREPDPPPPELLDVTE